MDADCSSDWCAQLTWLRVSEQEVPTFNKVKFTKFLTLIGAVRLCPVKGTDSWLGCGRSDLTLRGGKWRGDLYGFVSF